MPNQKLEKLKKVLEAMGEDALTLTQAKQLVEVLVTKLKTVSDELKKDTTNTKQDLEKQLNKAILSLKATEKKLTEADKSSQEVIKDVKPMIRQVFREIDDMHKMMPKMPDLSRHITVDNLDEFLPEMPELQPETPEGIRDKLEELKGDKRLDKKHIKGIENLVKEFNAKIESLETRTKESFSNIPRGGGTSALGVAQAFKWIAHTEEPVGDIDGVNLTYTVKNNIWWIAGFSLNGEQIAELPNFTYVNKTITFSTALPAAFSGKSFEVKYIGT